MKAITNTQFDAEEAALVLLAKAIATTIESIVDSGSQDDVEEMLESAVEDASTGLEAHLRRMLRC